MSKLIFWRKIRLLKLPAAAFQLLHFSKHGQSDGSCNDDSHQSPEGDFDGIFMLASVGAAAKKEIYITKIVCVSVCLCVCIA